MDNRRPGLVAIPWPGLPATRRWRGKVFPNAQLPTIRRLGGPAVAGATARHCLVVAYGLRWRQRVARLRRGRQPGHGRRSGSCGRLGHSSWDLHQPEAGAGARPAPHRADRAAPRAQYPEGAAAAPASSAAAWIRRTRSPEAAGTRAAAAQTGHGPHTNPGAGAVQWGEPGHPMRPRPGTAASRGRGTASRS